MRRDRSSEPIDRSGTPDDAGAVGRTARNRETVDRDRAAGRGGWWLRWTAVVVISALILCELFLRLVVGLGDPPLYLRHESIEYLLRPGEYRPFGNRFTVNEASMRSSADSIRPLRSGERRILVLGDSIVNGGAMLADDALATALLEEGLESTSAGAEVSVCNISAGSWGPPNLDAYLAAYGTFGATDCILVLNSADWLDQPTFEPLGADKPQSRPLLAVQDLVLRYAPRLLARRSGGSSSVASGIGTTGDTAEAIRSIVSRLKAAGVSCTVVLHPSRSEVLSGSRETFDPVRTCVRALGVPIVEYDGLLADAISSGAEPYRDDLHLSAAGQRLLGQVLLEVLGPAGGRRMGAPGPEQN